VNEDQTKPTTYVSEWITNQDRTFAARYRGLGIFRRRVGDYPALRHANDEHQPEIRIWFRSGSRADRHRGHSSSLLRAGLDFGYQSTPTYRD